MRRVFALALAGLLALSAPAKAVPPLAGPVTPPVGYRLRLDPLARTLFVTARFPAVPEPAVELVMASNHSALKDFCDNVRQVEARASDGAALRVRRTRSDRWLVYTEGRAFSLSYAVVSDKESFMGDEAVSELFHPTIFPESSFLWGWSYLLRPASGALSRLAVGAAVEAPAGQPVRTSWQEAEPVEGADRLAQSLLVAGNYRYYEEAVGATAVTFALSGSGWGFSDAAFVERTIAIVRAQTAMMGFHPERRVLVVLEEGSERMSGGGAAHGAIALYPRPGSDLAGVSAVIAHEHFHLWNGKLTRDDPKLPEGPLKWFTEGFTSYYAALTLYRMGLSDAAGFARALDAEIARYRANPARQATSEEMGRRYFSDRKHQELAYSKGMLIAWLMDLRIRHQTGGRKSLDDFMRLVMDFSRRGESYNARKLATAAEALTGRSWEDFFRRHVEGGEALPVGAIAREVGLPLGPGERLADSPRARRALARLRG